MKNFYNKGISLLEIIIVIANLTKFKSGQTLKNTTEEIVSLLNKAKLDSNSFLDSSIYSVYFATDRVVYFKGTTYSTSNSTNQVILFNNSVNIPTSGGINLTNPISANTITFPQLIEDVKGYGTIIIRETSNQTHQKTITVSKLGTISSN